MVLAFNEDYRNRPVKSTSDLNTCILIGRRIFALFPFLLQTISDSGI